VCFIVTAVLRWFKAKLRLAASLKVGIVVILFCDNSLNRIELKQHGQGISSWGTVIDPTDTVHLQGPMDCEGFQVARPRNWRRSYPPIYLPTSRR